MQTSKAERSRFVLDDEDILQAHWACIIEEHYGRPMDMEWAKDGETGELFVVQARPETVQSRREGRYVAILPHQIERASPSFWLEHWRCGCCGAGLPDRKREGYRPVC